MSTLTLPPVQHDPTIDNCLWQIDLGMTPTEDQPSTLQRLGQTHWVYLVILTSYVAGLIMGTWLT